MIVTNLNGNILSTHLKSNLSSSNEVNIASGYITTAGLNIIQNEINQFISSRKIIKLLIGMAFFEGLRTADFQSIQTLDNRLRTNNIGGVRVACLNPYHGKLYIFKTSRNYRIYVGSSNLSPSGISRNIECNILIQGKYSQSLVRSLVSFFNTLYRTPFSEDFNIVASSIPTVTTPVQPISRRRARSRRSGQILTPAIAPIQRILLQISVNPRSGLNWNFGAGRPRTWYEAYIPVPTHIQRSGFFPSRGTPFNVTTDDGWQFQCKVAGAGGKNLESHPTLDILGRWLKENKLGSVDLNHGQIVTNNHLTAYGRDNLEITRLSATDYFFDFS